MADALACYKRIVLYEDKLVSTAVPLDRMSTADKLRAVEEIWEDLSPNPGNIPAPAWHDDVLKARERRIEEGTATFEDWAEVKGDSLTELDEGRNSQRG